MDIARRVIGILTVIALPPAVVWWFLVHPFVGFWRRIGPAGTITTMTVLGLAGTWWLFGYRTALLGRDLGTSWTMIVVGAALVVPGMMIAFRRRRHLTTRILAGVPELEEGGKGGKLLCEGIYGVIRHPRYVEVALVTLGYACFANYVGAYVVALLTVPALHLIVLIEERELEDRFGEEYVAYKADVPRYIPRR